MNSSMKIERKEKWAFQIKFNNEKEEKFVEMVLMMWYVKLFGIFKIFSRWKISHFYDQYSLFKKNLPKITKFPSDVNVN